MSFKIGDKVKHVRLGEVRRIVNIIDNKVWVVPLSEYASYGRNMIPSFNIWSLDKILYLENQK